MKGRSGRAIALSNTKISQKKHRFSWRSEEGLDTALSRKLRAGSLLTHDISIGKHFSNLNDPRRVTKNIRHNFSDILVIAISAVICGADDWVSVEAFGNAKKEWFESFLELPNGIPSHDTFTDVFSKIDPDNFQSCFISWVEAWAKIIPDEVVAIDGKTVRRSQDLPKSKKAIHIVSAYAENNKLVLGQTKTEEKSNEITAIPKQGNRSIQHQNFSEKA